MNILRKHLDRVKGGGIIKMASPSTVISLILSDVVGNPLDVIASGPTVPDPSTFLDAIEVLKKYNLEDIIPSTIRDTLYNGLKGNVVETLKDEKELLGETQNVVVGSNSIAAEAAVHSAKQLGFNTSLLTTYLEGEASEVGLIMGSLLQQICQSGDPLYRPACIVAGGETTVTVSGPGLGGRNTEICLGAVKKISGLMDVALISLATDGEDRLEKSAGAIVCGDTYKLGKSRGLDPDVYLKNNDSYTYFNNVGSILNIGSTGTNVNDLIFLFAF